MLLDVDSLNVIIIILKILIKLYITCKYIFFCDFVLFLFCVRKKWFHLFVQNLIKYKSVVFSNKNRIQMAEYYLWYFFNR